MLGVSQNLDEDSSRTLVDKGARYFRGEHWLLYNFVITEPMLVITKFRPQRVLLPGNFDTGLAQHFY